MAKGDERSDQEVCGEEEADGDPIDEWLRRRASRPSEGLAEVQRAFTTLLENIPGMAYRCANDRNYTMEFVSGKAEEVTGYAPDELCDNRVVAYGELIHPDDRDGVWAKVQQALEAREAFQLKYRIRDRDGQVRWVYEQGCGVFDGDELEALEGFITDVTEQRQIERRFSRAERMNTIGRLLEHVADDFKDRLSIVMSYSEFVRDELDEESAAGDDIERVIAAADEASNLIRQLLKFGRPDSAEPELISPNGFLHNHDEAMHVVAGEEAELDWDLEPEVGRTEIAPAHLKEVLTSLALNAREAMQDGGTIAIRTGRAGVGEGEAFDHPETRPGEYVTIEVEDDGEGMSERTRSRAYEPYFTTKDPEESGEGRRGMGLTTAYGFVRQAGGHLRLESTPGEGTRVTVYLPRVDEQGEVVSTGRPRSESAR